MSTPQQHSLTSNVSNVEGRRALARTFTRPPQPTFASVGEERLQRKQKLIAAFRIFGKRGYDEGVMGHISARDPENPHHFWTNPFGVGFDVIRIKDLHRVSLEGELIEGEGYRHPGGVPLHSAILSLRPDIVSAVHTHSIYGRTWTATGRLLSPTTSEAAVFYGKHAIYDSYAGGEGDNLVQALQGNRALLMKNHGLLTVGQSVDEAAYLFISLEKICQSQIAAEIIKADQVIDEERAHQIAERFQPYNGWLNFQPLYQSIVKEQPDLLQ